MDQSYNKIFLFFLLILSACISKKPVDRFLNLIENQYANYHVNNEAHKKEVVADLREYFKTHRLNDQNMLEIKKKLSMLNDGHVVLLDERPEKNIQYVSGLKFFIGTEMVESCEECYPVVFKNKYKILKVNEVSYEKFQKNSQQSVTASTQ